MWLSMLLFTLGAAGISTQQFTYWLKKGMRREAWLFLGCMVFVWVVGLSFIGGFRLPAPTKPFLPAWK